MRDITKPTKASSNGTYEIAQDGICNPLLPIPPPQVRASSTVYVFHVVCCSMSRADVKSKFW